MKFQNGASTFTKWAFKTNEKNIVKRAKKKKRHSKTSKIAKCFEQNALGKNTEKSDRGVKEHCWKKNLQEVGKMYQKQN